MSLLLDFLRTGCLGEIALDSSLSEVESKFGKPEDVSVSRNPLIYKYGCSQLSFTKNKRNIFTLNSIHVYFDQEIRFPKSISPIHWYPELTFSKFFCQLEKLNISTRLDEEHTIQKYQWGYSTEAGVIIIFVLNDADKLLASFHYSK